MNMGKHFHSFIVLLEIYVMVDFLSFPERALFNYLELFHLGINPLWKFVVVLTTYLLFVNMEILSYFTANIQHFFLYFQSIAWTSILTLECHLLMTYHLPSSVNHPRSLLLLTEGDNFLHLTQDIVCSIHYSDLAHLSLLILKRKRQRKKHWTEMSVDLPTLPH